MDVQSSIDARLAALLRDHPVCVFLRGNSQKPACAASARVAEILDACDCPYLAVDVQQDPEIRSYLHKSPDFSEFPQVFLNSELLGGEAILSELHSQGELAPMLRQLTESYRLAG